MSTQETNRERNGKVWICTVVSFGTDIPDVTHGDSSRHIYLKAPDDDDDETKEKVLFYSLNLVKQLLSMTVCTW